MKLSNRVITFLDHHAIDYELVYHERTATLAETARVTGIPQGQIARAVILHAHKHLKMAILPADHIIDFDAVMALTGHRMKPAPSTAIGTIFNDCEAGTVPPVSTPYGIESLLDTALLKHSHIYLEPGNHAHLLCLHRDDFLRLHRHALRGEISRPSNKLSSQDESQFVKPNALISDMQIESLRPLAGLKERIASLRSLPAMPHMASNLLRLLNNEEPSIEELAQVIEQDPSLAAQVVRYARSPYFSYQGEIESVEDAIKSVLGFDMVLNMALGLATSRSFNNPSEGALGLNAFWRHAVYSATLCQLTARELPANLGIKPGMAYLAGLLHNIGFLLMGHVLKPEFYLLNKVVGANPDIPVTLIEKRVLGITHGQIGAWLMRAWNMPGELLVAVREHHNEYYHGQYAGYANLVQLIDHLLKGYEIGDAASAELPTKLLNNLGLNEEQVRDLAIHILEDETVLQNMAAQLAA